MTKELNLFIPITKVDEEKRLVYGIATAELPDKSGEICDYATTVPYYKAWSSQIEKNTDGKSKGNLRSMHAAIAAGKVTQIEFNDAEKQIEICAKVVDADEWNKVIEGVYTGFSQGGSYVKTWKDGQQTRYTADPSEISLVDNPCLGAATFTLLRAGGAAEMRKFKETIPEIDNMHRQIADPVQVWKAHDGSTFATKAECLQKNAEIKAQATAQPAIDAMATLDSELKKKEFSDDERKKLADSGAALPDGSFPIENKEDLANAIHAYGRAKDQAAAKAHIISRAKALDATDMLPADWEGSTKKADDAEKSVVIDLKKFVGEEVYDAATAMDALTLVLCLFQNEQWEAQQSAENPEQLADLKIVIERLKSFIASEIEEDNSDDGNGMHGTIAAAAGIDNDLNKIGAKISGATKETIMKMHKSASDHLGAMTECCKGLGLDMEGGESDDNKDDDNAAKMAALEELNKSLIDEKNALQSTVGTLTTSIDSIIKRVKHLEAQPMPTKGKLFNVSKSNEVLAGDEPVDTSHQKERQFVPSRVTPEEYRMGNRT